MKKLFVLMIMCITAVQVYAQFPNFDLKLQAGMNQSFLSVPTSLESMIKSNYVMSVDATLGSKNAVQLGVSARKYSSSQKFSAGIVNISIPTTSMHAYYVHRLMSFKVVKFSAFAGPELEFTGAPTLSSTLLSIHDFNPKIWNASFGAELKILKFLITAQYVVGMTDLINPGPSKNNVFVLKAGFSFF